MAGPGGRLSTRSTSQGLSEWSATYGTVASLQPLPVSPQAKALALLDQRQLQSVVGRRADSLV